MGRDLFLPVGIGDLSLLEAVLGKVCVCPYCGAVAVQFGPVALDVCQIRAELCLSIALSYVPSWSAIVALSSIVETLSMTAHEQHLVHSIKVRISVQGGHDLSEPLPLSGIASARSRVCLVDETKVDGSLRRCVRFAPSRSLREQHT